eukprot:c29302_g1_i1 orf=194-5161(-)
MASAEEDDKLAATVSGDRHDGGDSSDDDSDTVPGKVDNYWLEDGQEQPISISILPLDSGDSNNVVSPTPGIFLRGTADSGLQRVYVKAEAWKLQFSKDDKVTFSIRTKQKHWIQLLKPRKSYEELIRGLLVVAEFLDFVQKNPEASEKATWNRLNEVFCSWEVKPSPSDLSPHLNVIEYYMKSQKLEASTVMTSVVSSLSKKMTITMEEELVSSSKSASDQKKSKNKFVESNVSDLDEDTRSIEQNARSSRSKNEEGADSGAEDFFSDNEFEEVGDISEPVCAICDNGGNVLCCDGPCMRSFHLNKEAGGAEDSSCKSLGFSKEEVEEMDKFFCRNCEYKQHQCYACGVLGCSDESRPDAVEVFICDAAICGRFYHADCVAKLLIQDNESEAAALEQRIRNLEGFSCPIHKCLSCHKGENPDEEDLHFAICRRCPRAWHRKCLPSSILFEATDDEPERAWEDLLPNNRILIYCKRHKIVPSLGTPARNHLKFPEPLTSSSVKGVVKIKPEVKAPKRQLDKESTSKLTAQNKRIKLDTHITKHKLDLEDSAPSPRVKPELAKVKARALKSKTDDVSTAYAKERKPSALFKSGKELPAKTPILFSKKVEMPLKKKDKFFGHAKHISVEDPEVKSTVDAIIKRSKESITLESIIEKHDVPRCYRRSNKTPDKKYSLTKIESIIKAMRRALETLDKGGSIDDAKTKCSESFVKFLDGCKNELKVYLAPFLFGMRYTSFGRHFTKQDKLREVVYRLQWYVEDGDMVVDMCCGSNDFSVLMKERIAQTGKKCEFKNFDIIQPKNDFNFEKRDWFQVKEGELPVGSRLIMGLNPPFGVKAQLANSFINHALDFKPKLVILIVPKETERLDLKPEKYNLIWEDPELLKGESFYLPGSVDVNENPLSDWNVVAPPLYLWSRPDWTQKHRVIAEQQGHVKVSTSEPSTRFAGEPWKMPPRVNMPSSLAQEARLEKQRIEIERRAKTEPEKISVTTESANPVANESTGKQVGMVEPIDTTWLPGNGVRTSQRVTKDHIKDINTKAGDQGKDSSVLVTEPGFARLPDKSNEVDFRSVDIGHKTVKDREITELGDRETIGSQREGRDKYGKDSSERSDREDSRKQEKREDRDKRSRDTHYAKDRNENRDRNNKNDDKGRSESRDRSRRHDDRDRYDRHEARDKYDKGRQIEQRKLSPDRYDRRSEEKMDSLTYGGRDAPIKDDSSKYFISNRDGLDDLKQSDKRARLEDDNRGSSTRVGSSEVHYDWRRSEREDPVKNSWSNLEMYHSDDRVGKADAVGSEGSYRQREFGNLDLNVQNEAGLYDKEAQRRRDFSDFDSQRREAIHLPRDSRDFKDQVAANVHLSEGARLERDYSERNAYGSGTYLESAYLNPVATRVMESIGRNESGELHSRRTEDHFSTDFSLTQRGMDYGDIHIQGRDRTYLDYSESKSQGVGSFGFGRSYVSGNYQTSDILGGRLGGNEMNHSNEWQRVQHEPYIPKDENAFHGTLNKAGLALSTQERVQSASLPGWASSNPTWQTSQRDQSIEPLLQSLRRPGEPLLHSSQQDESIEPLLQSLRRPGEPLLHSSQQDESIEPLLQSLLHPNEPLRQPPLHRPIEPLMSSQPYLGIQQDIQASNRPAHTPYGARGGFSGPEFQFTSHRNQGGWDR